MHLLTTGFVTMRYLVAAALGSLLVLLSGCGQKGDLYLPPATLDQASPQQHDGDNATNQNPVDDQLPSE